MSTAWRTRSGAYRVTTPRSSIYTLCGARKARHPVVVLGVCERPRGHDGPHQEQRVDNGMPYLWTDKEHA